MRGARSSLLLITVLILSAGCHTDHYAFVIRPDSVHGSGEVAEEFRLLSGVSGVNLAAIGTLHVHQGAEEGIVIVAEDNLIPYLRTDLRGGMLWIGTDAGIHLEPTRPVTFHLTVADPSRVVLSGAGTIDCRDLAVGSLSVILSGAGDIALTGLEASNLEVVLTGVGGIFASGRAAEQGISITGTGDYEAGDLASDDSVVEITGLGTATVRVRDNLIVTISGQGSVFYLGDPAVVTTITGTGRVERIGP